MHDSGCFGINTTFTSSYVQLGQKQLLWAGGGKGLNYNMTHHHLPPTLSGAHLGLFGGKKSLRTRISTTTSQPFLTSINSEIDRRNDGNVLIARQILGNQRAKIRWGLLTLTKRCANLARLSLRCLRALRPFWSRLPEIHLQRTIVLVFT